MEKAQIRELTNPWPLISWWRQCRITEANRRSVPEGTPGVLKVTFANNKIASIGADHHVVKSFVAATAATATATITDIVFLMMFLACWTMRRGDFR